FRARHRRPHDHRNHTIPRTGQAHREKPPQRKTLANRETGVSKTHRLSAHRFSARAIARGNASASHLEGNSDVLQIASNHFTPPLQEADPNLRNARTLCVERDPCRHSVATLTPTRTLQEAKWLPWSGRLRSNIRLDRAYNSASPLREPLAP